MQKDFDNWNTRKKEINEREPNFYYEREIRWCSLGINIGFEQDGTSETYKRPVLIIKGFSRHVCLVVPLTTSKKENPYHLSVGIISGKEAFAILSQIRLIDTKRLHAPLAVLSKNKFKEIKKAIRIFFR
jgi:mRNA-degrading endonuclease toxin of MazEF toxin-antitoxin module